MDNNNFNQQPYEAHPNPYQQPLVPAKKKGLSITSMILGIASIVLCWLGGLLLGPAAVILGIISLNKKQDKKGMAITGIITGAVSFVFTIVMLVIIFIMFILTEDANGNTILSPGGVEYNYHYSSDGISLNYDDDASFSARQENIFGGNAYTIDDGSAIYFEEDGTFIWYMDDNDHTDYYYTGTYDCYTQDAGVDYIVNDLSDYGVTQMEMDDYFDRNADDALYSKENFVCLVLHNEEMICEGVNGIDTLYDTPYMGFYANGYYDAANMDSMNYIFFTQK